MQQTLSATPLEAVHVEQRGDIADVWLHRNIVHDWHDLPDGGSQEFWQADEVHGTMPAGTTAADVLADFDRIWDRFEYSDREYAEMVADGVTELDQQTSDALIELAELAANNEASIEELTVGLLELAEIIGGE